MTQQRASGERGFALLMALSGLAFLSFVAAATISDTRHDARLAAARAGEIEAGALAEAGIARAMLAIDEAWSSEAWPENGTPVLFRLGGGEIAVAIADEAGKVDLCAAPDLMVSAVFKHAGIAPARSPLLLNALRKVRAQAAMSQRTLAPASLEELGAMLAMTGPEIEAVRPWATVHSGLGGFDPVVGRALVALIPGVDPGRAQPQGPSRADAPERPPSPAPAFTAQSPRRMFTVRAEACTGSGHLGLREILIERRGPGDIRRIEVREPISPVLAASPCSRHIAKTDR